MKMLINSTPIARLHFEGLTTFMQSENRIERYFLSDVIRIMAKITSTQH